MSKEKKGFKINPFGSLMLIVVLLAVAGGWQLGKEYMRDKICNDIIFYNAKDADLVPIQDCASFIKYEERK